MNAKFWEEARKKRDEVEQRWMSEPLWKEYPKADIRCAYDRGGFRAGGRDRATGSGVVKGAA